MSQKRLKSLVRDLNRMMAVTPLNTADYRVLLEELRKAKEALRSPNLPGRQVGQAGSQFPIPNPRLRRDKSTVDADPTPNGQ